MSFRSHLSGAHGIGKLHDRLVFMLDHTLKSDDPQNGITLPMVRRRGLACHVGAGPSSPKVHQENLKVRTKYVIVELG